MQFEHNAAAFALRHLATPYPLLPRVLPSANGLRHYPTSTSPHLTYAFYRLPNSPTTGPAYVRACTTIPFLYCDIYRFVSFVALSTITRLPCYHISALSTTAHNLFTPLSSLWTEFSRTYLPCLSATATPAPRICTSRWRFGWDLAALACYLPPITCPLALYASPVYLLTRRLRVYCAAAFGLKLHRACGARRKYMAAPRVAGRFTRQQRCAATLCFRSRLGCFTAQRATLRALFAPPYQRTAALPACTAQTLPTHAACGLPRACRNACLPVLPFFYAAPRVCHNDISHMLLPLPKPLERHCCTALRIYRWFGHNRHCACCLMHYRLIGPYDIYLRCYLPLRKPEHWTARACLPRYAAATRTYAPRLPHALPAVTTARSGGPCAPYCLMPAAARAPACMYCQTYA